LKNFLTDNDVVFDREWHLFAFKNKIFDLKLGAFIPPNSQYYISQNTGYDWVEPTLEETDNVDNILISIFPDDEERDLFLNILCTGLEGRSLKKLVIFGGRYCSGKSTINRLFLTALGGFGHYANNRFFYGEEFHRCTNISKDSLAHKRYVSFNHDSPDKKIDVNFIKEMLGTNNEFTNIYGQTRHRSIATLTIEAYAKPTFNDLITDVDIIYLPFKSTFTDNLDLVNEERHIYRQDKNLNNDEFREKHRCALLYILFNTYKNYKDNGLFVPKSIKEETNRYVDSISKKLVDWLNEKYTIVCDDIHVLELRDIREKIMDDEYYRSMSITEKRSFNSNFTNIIKDAILRSKLKDNLVMNELNPSGYIKRCVESY